MDVIHYPPFEKLHYVLVIVDTCSYAYALALAGEKASHVIKALKLAVQVMGVPWALTIDNGPAYSRQLADFLISWKVDPAFGIPYNPQGQVTVERTNRSLKVLLAKVTSSEAKPDLHLALVEAPFHMNFLTFDKGLSPAYKHLALQHSSSTG